MPPAHRESSAGAGWAGVALMAQVHMYTHPRTCARQSPSH